MLEIQNLTKRQKDLMDLMWSFQEEEHFVEWYIALNEEDQKTVESLFVLLTIELNEQIVELTNFKEAKDVLSKYMKKT